MDSEILKLPRTLQGARIKAFEKRWLFHLGFTDEERIRSPVLEIKLTFLPDGKIMMERGITEPILKPPEVSGPFVAVVGQSMPTKEMVKKLDEVASCQ